MKAQELFKYVQTDTVAKQAFVDVQGDVFLKLNKALDNMKAAKVLPGDAKEIFEYGLRAGQFMALTEVFTGFQLDAKEDGETIKTVEKVVEKVKTQTAEFTCPNLKK